MAALFRPKSKAQLRAELADLDRRHLELCDACDACDAEAEQLRAEVLALRRMLEEARLVSDERSAAIQQAIEERDRRIEDGLLAALRALK